MPKRWEELSADEKADQLRHEMDHKNGQVASLQAQLNELHTRLRQFEEKAVPAK